jgi:membrane protein DedA with SNARE-associated domain
VTEYFHEFLTSYIAFSPYVAIFLLLTIGIWFMPLAEEIALITAGYLYYSSQVRLVPVLTTAGAGVFVGDFLAFWMGRRWGGTRLQSTLAFLGNHWWLNKVKALLDQHGMRALFYARFLPGVRLFAHVLVGVHGMSVATYTQISLLSITIYVPVVFALAYACGEEIDAALSLLNRLGNVAWGMLLFVVGLWFILRLRPVTDC